MESIIKENIGRFYKIKDNLFYPSVTTVLSYIKDKKWLEDWKKRVGEENAKKITKESTDIGSYLHYLFECFFANEKPREPRTEEEKKALKMFNISKNKAKKLIDEVLFQEKIVWSDNLRVAGRFDLLGMKNDELILIDFKNYKNFSKDKVETYRQQLSFYSVLIKETLNLEVDYLKIFMVNRDGFTQVLSFSKDDVRIEELKRIMEKFWEKYEKEKNF